MLRFNVQDSEFPVESGIEVMQEGSTLLTNLEFIRFLRYAKLPCTKVPDSLYVVLEYEEDSVKIGTNRKPWTLNLIT